MRISLFATDESICCKLHPVEVQEFDKLIVEEKLKKYFDSDRFAALCGLELLECRPGYSKVQVKIGENHLNPAGVVHGGLLFTLADFCFGAAANAHGRLALTINTSMAFIAPSSEGGILFAEAREKGRRKRLLTYDVDVSDESGRILAHFTGMAYDTHKEIEF